MGSSSEVKRSSHAIIVQPNETVLTAFPYGPQSSLLDFLRGEPRVLGAVQILLALVIVSIGTIFAFNYFSYSQRFPLVFCTGYPFWGALIFTVTGYVTGFHRRKKGLEQGVMAMNVISSLAAVAGIALTIISFQYQHRYCDAPSIKGICVIGRVLFSGILSVLLLISLVELSISVTIASFRSKCWAKSNEIVFLLPLDVTHESELSNPEENAVIQMGLQEESNRDDLPTNIQPVFFGGYTFFKLRVSRNPLTFHRSGKRGSSSYYTSSSGSDEQQKNSPSTPTYYEDEIELKPLPPVLDKRPSEDTTHVEQINDTDLQLAVEQPSELPQAETSPPQVSPSPSVKSLPKMPSQDMLSQVQVLPTQALLSKVPIPHVTQSYDLTSEDMPSQDIPSENTKYEDMASQDLQMKTMQLETQTIHAMQALSAQQQEQQSLGLHLQNIQHLDRQFSHMSFQDIESEVNLLTQEWKHEKHQVRKSTKQYAFDHHCKDRQSSTKKFLDLPIQAPQSPRKKSLDQHIKGWLFPKKHSIDKQFSDQQTEDQLPQGKQSLRRKSQNGQGKGQQDKGEKYPRKQSQHKDAKDLQVQEEKSPEQLDQHLQSQIQKYQDWQTLCQQSQDWSMQGWRNKEYKAQEGQFEMKRSLNWESQAWQTQDLLEKEFLKQKVRYKETHTLHAIPQHHLDQQSQDVVSPESQCLDKNQQGLRSTGTPKKHMQIVPVPTKDLKLVDRKSLCQKSSDLQSEYTKPDFPHASCQSSVQDAFSTYLSNVGSEQDMPDVQQNTSMSSTLTTYCTRDPQQSEDSE